MCPVRYNPNPKEGQSDPGDVSIPVSTSTADGFLLRYVGGKMLWEAQGRTQWDIYVWNVDDPDNPSDYVGTSTNTSEYDFDGKNEPSGIYSVVATDSNGETVASDRINIVRGLDTGNAPEIPDSPVPDFPDFPDVPAGPDLGEEIINPVEIQPDPEIIAPVEPVEIPQRPLSRSGRAGVTDSKSTSRDWFTLDAQYRARHTD